jgi:ankyrin repeat protein
VSAIFYAAWEGHVEVVELLLAHGANVNSAENYNITLLIHSIRMNAPLEMIDLLVTRG